MPALRLLLACLFLSLLCACSGSEAYRGAWKATTPDGGHASLFFEAKKLRVTAPDGKLSEYDYRQNKVKISNTERSYGIQLGDGRGYTILFPVPKQDDVGLVLDDRSGLLYVISRKDYLQYEDLNKL